MVFITDGPMRAPWWSWRSSSIMGRGRGWLPHKTMAVYAKVVPCIIPACVKMDWVCWQSTSAGVYSICWSGTKASWQPGCASTLWLMNTGHLEIQIEWYKWCNEGVSAVVGGRCYWLWHRFWQRFHRGNGIGQEPPWFCPVCQYILHCIRPGSRSQGKWLNIKLYHQGHVWW